MSRKQGHRQGASNTATDQGKPVANGTDARPWRARNTMDPEAGRGRYYLYLLHAGRHVAPRAGRDRVRRRCRRRMPPRNPQRYSSSISPAMRIRRASPLGSPVRSWGGRNCISGYAAYSGALESARVRYGSPRRMAGPVGEPARFGAAPASMRAAGRQKAALPLPPGSIPLQTSMWA